MIENIIAKTICNQRIVHQVSPKGHPVFREFLRAKDKNIIVTSFVIPYNSQSCERLSEADAVSEDAAVVLFQFIDNTESRILLEIIKFVPDHTVPEASRLIGKNIL